MTSEVIDALQCGFYSGFKTRYWSPTKENCTMTAYAIGLLEDLDFGPDIVTYLQRIDATLAPFGGEFLVHGTRPELKEGRFGGDCVVIGFPSMAQARAWYESDAYAPLIPLRTEHSRSTVFLLEGVKEGVDYRAASLLGKLGAAA